MQRQADATIAMIGIQIDPKEEEKLMGIKGKLLQLVILMLGKEAWRHGAMK
jgi:hypothetical protein